MTVQEKTIQRTDLATWAPHEVRQAIRDRRWTGTTHGAARGRLQANLVVLPQKYAFDFLRFCLRNPRPCPVIDVTDPGSAEPTVAAPGADLRTDLSSYRVYRNGELTDTVPDLLDLWTEDHVGFLLGCSLSFDEALDSAGIPMPHLRDTTSRVSTFRSNIPCVPAGPFSGPMVVTMRPVPTNMVVRAVEVTGRYPLAHGAPVHIGDAADIGITDLENPEFVTGDRLGEGQTSVFWGCGVTPQAVAMAARIPEMFTHHAGHMFVTDLALDGTPKP
ncbi:putative hydro-lyase [Rhodovarius crocodyli]|uniref:Putative hydro-lyase n=1 Tax=Rhodovarius crocodyli TaxID=1979269 RepID=A0A437MPG6_9PROT|nr:putative hydro-lyase [Rhodovarius crocodyli]RVT99542.1 putative hydro-lyase [Rhodovarius crocodyli]